MYAYSIGPKIKAMENAAPILIPMQAMALVLHSILVKSAASAISAAATAPAPWSARPTNKPCTESALAAIKLPIPKIISPSTIIGFLPHLSDSMPNGICRLACV